MSTNDTSSFLGTEEQPLYTPNSDERMLAMLSHILAIIPGIGILGPLIIYVIKSRDAVFVAHHARESLNFQITVFLAYVISFILMLLLVGFLMAWLVGIMNTILVIVATIRANDGKLYRYPFSIRLVS